MRRCEDFGVAYYVLHPGSALDGGFTDGMRRIVYGIDEVYSEMGTSVMLLLETTAGMGSSIGGKFEHLQEICEKSKYGDHIGICLDTCHIYVAGYDITGDYDSVMDDVSGRFGDKLRCIHMNDSKGALGSHKDRHALIGQGEIGLEPFRRLVNDERLSTVLGLLETPVDENYTDEIKLLKSLREAGY